MIDFRNHLFTCSTVEFAWLQFQGMASRGMIFNNQSMSEGDFVTRCRIQVAADGVSRFAHQESLPLWMKELSH